MKYTTDGGWTVNSYPKNKDGDFVVPVGDIVLHKLTESNPVMTDEQYEAFKEDITLNGQVVTAVAYKGKIVDGRHRLKVLREIGFPTIKVKQLPNNYTLKQVRAEVKSMETRRHKTPGQLAVEAYYLMKKEDISSRAAGTRVGVSHSAINKCSVIEKKIGSEALDRIYSNKTIYYNGRNCRSVNDLYTQIKKVEKEEERLNGNQGNDNVPNVPEDVLDVYKIIASFKRSGEMTKIAAVKTYCTRAIDELNKD